MAESGEVAGVEDAELRSAVASLPRLPNIRVEDPDRYAQAVRALLEDRAQRGWPGESDADEAGAFALVSRPREHRERLGAKPVMDLCANNQPVLGRLFLLTRDGGRGEVIPLPCAPEDLPDWLVENGLGEAPLVMAYRPTAMMVVRRSGIEGEITRKDHIRDKPPAATLQELHDALAHFHLAQLLTPGFCVAGVWERSRAHAYVPGPQPERSIQAALAIALNSWFHGIIRAEVEDSTSVGRIDVRLLLASGGSLTYWAVVELKVIKSFANAKGKAKAAAVTRGANIEAIDKGIRQAWAYGENRQTMGLLEVYDLRQDKSEDLFVGDEIKAVLSELSPVPSFSVRPLYGSADDARRAGQTGV